MRFTQALDSSAAFCSSRDVAVEDDAVADAAVRDPLLQRRPVVAVAGDVEVDAGDRLHDVEQQLDPLVLLEPAEVEQARLDGALGRREARLLHAEVGDVDAVGGQLELQQVAAAGVRDREERRVAVERPQRQRLGEQGRDRAGAAQLGDVVVAVDVVDERHARAAQPQRGEEADPVDDLERDVGVAADAPHPRQRRAREHREPRAHAVDRQVRGELLARGGAGVGAGDHRHAVAPRDPARDLPVEVGPRPAALRVRPVAIREQEDVPRLGHRP